MGFDLHGKHYTEQSAMDWWFDKKGGGPERAATAGAYFRANVGAWSVICGMLRDSGVLDDETLTRMNFNDGYGVTDSKTCQRLAEYFESLVPEAMEDSEEFWREGVDPTSAEPGTTAIDGSFPECMGTPGWARIPYWTSAWHLRRLIDFLKNCDGFKVW